MKAILENLQGMTGGEWVVISTCLALAVLLIVHKASRRRPRRKMGFWHETPEVLRDFTFDDSKAHEHDPRQ